MNFTAYQLAERFIGLKEVPGSNPQIVAFLQLEAPAVHTDQVPWCSAFVNYIAWLMRLPRSKSLAARSWLSVGTPVLLADARQGFDVVILKRLGATDGPEVLDAPGHVGFFSSYTKDPGSGVDWVYVLGGNQGNQVCVERFNPLNVLGVRRLGQG